MKKLLAIITILISLFALSLLLNSRKNTKEINVAVAANARFAANELKEEFFREKGIKANMIISSSGKLSAQIKNGAPFDMFLSADTSYPEILAKEGYSLNKPEIYAYGSLVLWTFRDISSDKNIYNLLTDNNIKKIAIANPALAPYGKEAMNVLKYNNLENKLKGKLVFAESISQVNNYINTKTVDLGFSSKSTVMAPEMKNKGNWLEIDKNQYSPIAQAMIIIKSGKPEKEAMAKEFFQYILSENGRRILGNYGYIFPEQKDE